MLADALKAATDRASAIISEIDAQRERFQATIRPLEDELAELQDVIGRVDPSHPLAGRQTAPAPSRSRARRSSSAGGGPSAGEIDANRIVSFLGAHPGSYAVDIASGIGIDVDGKTPPGLSIKLREMVEAGTLQSEGERRWTKYIVRNG